MKSFVALASGVIFGVILSVLLICVAVSASSQPAASSTVRVVLAEAHGSAVHIGDGFYLTAAHVVDKEKTVRFQTDQGEDYYTADVMWSNTDYDVALLRARAVDITKATPLTCRVPKLDEEVTVSGSPIFIKVFRAKGQVSSPDIVPLGDWTHVFVVTGPVTNGMSGGPVITRSGRLLGIIVGGARPHPMSFAVPTSTICKLLGRVS